MEDDPIIKGQRLSTLRVVDLKEELKDRGLSIVGNKSVLADRLKEYLLETEALEAARAAGEVPTVSPVKEKSGSPAKVTSPTLDWLNMYRATQAAKLEEQKKDAARVRSESLSADETSVAPTSTAPEATTDSSDEPEVTSPKRSPRKSRGSTSEQNEDVRSPTRRSARSQKEDDQAENGSEEAAEQPAEVAKTKEKTPEPSIPIKKEPEASPVKTQDPETSQAQPAHIAIKKEPETVAEKAPAPSKPDEAKTTPAAAVKNEAPAAETTPAIKVKQEPESPAPSKETNKSEAPKAVEPVKEEVQEKHKETEKTKEVEKGDSATASDGKRSESLTSPPKSSEAEKITKKEAPREATPPPKEKEAARKATPPPKEKQTEKVKIEAPKATLVDGEELDYGDEDDDDKEKEEEQTDEPMETSQTEPEPEGEKTEDKEAEETTTEKPAAVNSSLSNRLSRRIVMESKSEAVEDDVKKPKQVEADRHPESDTVHIRGLTRPFTQNALQNLITSSGKYTVVEFWIDSLRSHCFAQMASVEEAKNVRAALHDERWPDHNTKTLSVHFDTLDNLVRHREGRPPVATAVDAAPAPTKDSSRRISERTERPTLGALPGRGSLRITVEAAVRDNDKKTQETKERKERDADVATNDRKRRRSDTPPFSRGAVEKKRERKDSPERRRRADSSVEKEQPKTIKSADALFQKTKAQPSLFWLALTEEEAMAGIARREAEKKRMEERAKERQREREERSRR